MNNCLEIGGRTDEASGNRAEAQTSKKCLTRRDFIRKGMIGAGACCAVAAGSAGSRAAQATSEQASSVQDSKNAASPDAQAESGGEARTVTTHECDVLVLGGGLAGMEAALRVVSQGKTAYILDKGVFGHSGTSGMNWGHTYQSMELVPEDDATIASCIATMSMVCEGLINQPYFYNLLKAQYEERPMANALRYGSIPLYNEDGTVLSHNLPYAAFPVIHDQGFWPRMMAQWCRRDGHVTGIFENYYVLDYLTDADGRAAGAVAVNLRDGSAHVFRAKATVLALGSYCWITGWNGIGAESMTGKECTGDGIAMLLRHGVPMVDMEQFCGDASQWTPAGTRQTMGNQNFDASQTPYDCVFDKDMTSFTDLLAPYAGQYYSVNMGNTAKIMFALRRAGMATENGGVMLDKSCAPVLPRYFRKTAQREQLFLGYELPDFYEAVPETWDSAGCPRDLSETSETIVPGLFFAGAAPGGVGGMTQIAAQSGGWLAANGALALCDQLESAPAVDGSQVESILAHAYDYVDRTVEEPLRASAVMHDIQSKFWPRDTGPMRNAEELADLIAELQRIIDEDLPRIYVADKSLHMNLDWRDALETENMAWCALASAIASNTRTETRGYNMRTDYPATDNAVGLANTLVSLNEDGTWNAEMAPLHDELIPADTLATLIPTCFSLDMFQQDAASSSAGA